MTGKIVVVEGVDASGKSGLSAELAKRFTNSVVFHNPKGISEISNDVYKVLQTHVDVLPDVKIALMAATHIQNAIDVLALSEGGKTVIVDRGLVSLYAYQDFHEIGRFFSYLDIAHVPRIKPDFSFYLTANRETIIKRITEREDFTSLDAFFLKRIDGVMAKYEYSYKTVYPNMVRIDTTNLTPAEVVEEAWRNVNG